MSHKEIIVLKEDIACKSLISTRRTWLNRLKNSLANTRHNLGSKLINLFNNEKISDAFFESLEEQLLVSDIGVETTHKIISKLKLINQMTQYHLKDTSILYNKLREEMTSILTIVDKPLIVTKNTPFIILIIGVNGVGKTTTIGKLAYQYQIQGKRVLLAAGDTFRAAAIEQLQVWGKHNHIPVVAQHIGADPASVIFDAIQSAQAHDIDVLIIDTAGRLHNKVNLIAELTKIIRIIKKLDFSAPHETMLILDASIGQNSVNQAKLFNDAVTLTGITLTKLDGTAKGGIIFAIANNFRIPIRYIGIGEGLNDLRPFKSDDFIEALFPK